MSLHRFLPFLLLPFLASEPGWGRVRCEQIWSEAATTVSTASTSLPARIWQRVKDGPRFDHASFKNEKQILETLSDAELLVYRPETPEHKLAWLETLAKSRTGQAIDRELQTETLFRSQRSGLLRLLKAPVEKWGPRKIDQLLETMYLEKNLYWSLVARIPRLRFSEIESAYLRDRLQRDLWRKGAVEALREAGVMSPDPTLYERWKRISPAVTLVTQSVLGVSMIVSSISMGQVNGAILPVKQWIRLKNLPPALVEKLVMEGPASAMADVQNFLGWKAPTETANWILSKTLMRLTTIIGVWLALDQTLEILGVDPKQIVTDFLANREILEEAALESLIQDAAEMGYEIDESEARARLKDLSVQELRASARETSP